MATTIIRPKTHAEWLDIRKRGIGSSEVGTILYLNPYETPYQLWRRKRGIDPPKEENFAMRAGHYLEDAVSRFWADETGRQIIKRSSGDWIIQSGEKPYMQVSPDRTYWLDGKKTKYNKGILECKTTQYPVDADSVPEYWVAQLQYQLGVAELEQGAIAWLTAGREFGYKPFELDREFFRYASNQVEEFWRKNVIEGIEPLEYNAEDVQIKYPMQTDGKFIEADTPLVELCENLRKIRSTLNEYSKQKKDLEDLLKLSFGDAERLVYRGDTVATWKASKPSTKFDEKRFAAEHPEIYAQYQYQAAGSRRLLIK